MRRLSVALAILVTAAPAAPGAQTPGAPGPRIVNGRLTMQAAGSLPQTFQAAVAAHADVGWIGYAVPMVEGDRTMCCSSSGNTWNGGRGVANGDACCNMCRLEPSAAGSRASALLNQPAGPIKLEGPDRLMVLVRVVNRQVERVRIFSEECPLDAGGRDVLWLTDVSPAASVALLGTLAAGLKDRRERTSDGTVGAIALHDDPAADVALERLLGPTQPQWLRAKVPFWLGTARGRRGLEILRKVVTEDPSAEVKKKAVFGIAQSGEPDAVQILIDHARTHGDPAVRGEAIFWLAQKAGTKAAGTITERIEQDPDTEVKKRAVFALSQLPANEGVPLLIQVAGTHSNPAVRKQAMFWLGQSKDPRALDFFAEILK